MFNPYSVLPLALLFIVCDLPWLYVSRKWSQKMFEKVQGGIPLRVRWEGVPIVYAALAILIQSARSTTEAGVIGLSSYAIYDFTNYSILKKYSLQFALMDTIWGGILMTIVWNIVKRY